MQTLKDISVQFIKGVGPVRKKLFFQLGIESVEDLLYFFPRRYEDRREITALSQVKLGEWQTVQGRVLTQGARKSWYTKKHVTEVLIDDGKGQMICVWFNQPYLEYYLKPGVRAVLYGKVDRYKNRIQMVAPEYEIIDEDDKESLNIGRIVPMYSLTRGITQRYLRKIIKACLDKYHEGLRDELPVPIRNKYRLSNIKRSIEAIHFPPSLEDQESALKRISFEEFFFFQVSVILRRLSITQKEGIAHQIPDAFILNFIHSFPFELTHAQKRVIREVKEDMEKSSPMLRLLQGDVGAGKTLVALFGCMASFHNGFQSAIMAPTEILAQQHFQNIQSLLHRSPFKKIRLAFLTSSIKNKEREEIYRDITSGNYDLVIGTHALINEEVKFKNLSFVVVDEQHKFGVRQRALLTQKGANPHILIMTATPIPRTLCLTLYGDLDLSVLDELPPGRGKVKTLLFAEEEANKVYELVKKRVKEGEQAYIVYPIIEESSQEDLKAAKMMFKRFQAGTFKDFRLGIVHGQLKRAQTEKAMEQFKNQKIDILLATTILEVGIDIPQATVMVIEHADRFGLAQLHQLRGRIQRSEKEGLCLLIADPTTAEAKLRLEAICSSSDGFKIAEKDLLIRGPGYFFGRHQHGLNELKVANPLSQLELLELARREASTLTNNDPKLTKPVNQNIKNVIKRRYPTYLEMVEAG